MWENTNIPIILYSVLLTYAIILLTTRTSIIYYKIKNIISVGTPKMISQLKAIKYTTNINRNSHELFQKFI